MKLIDTNIFLEILLEQEKSENCKHFLVNNIDTINISDFALHSIGVILFKQNEEKVFNQFIDDILPAIQIKTLPKNQYTEIHKITEDLGLDFDDAYQYAICKCFDLEMVTMDNDFKGITDIKVNLL